MSSKVAAKPAAAGQPKGMSSRLLTMKFMQRATVQKSSKPAPGTDKSAHRKQSRQDYNALQNALKEEQRIKEEAERKHDEITGVKDDGETRWELAIVPPRGAGGGLNVRVLGEEALGGDSEEDSASESEEEEEGVSRGFGRLSFGQFNKEIEKLNGTNADESSESESEEETKVKKEVSLKHLSSISGGQSGKPGRPDDRKCFNCNKSGHLSAECPNKGLDTRTCYVCNKVGHLSADCPQSEQRRGSLKRKSSNGDFLTIRDEGGKRRKSRP